MRGAFKQTSFIKNVHANAIEVWFEPWGMNHLLPSGASFTLEIESEIEGQLVIDDCDEGIAVYAYPTSTIKVLWDGVVIDEFIAFPLSALPANLSTKEFIQFLFGGPGQPRSSQDAE